MPKGIVTCVVSASLLMLAFAVAAHGAAARAAGGATRWAVRGSTCTDDNSSEENTGSANQRTGDEAGASIEPNALRYPSNPLGRLDERTRRLERQLDILREAQAGQVQALMPQLMSMIALIAGALALGLALRSNRAPDRDAAPPPRSEPAAEARRAETKPRQKEDKVRAAAPQGRVQSGLPEVRVSKDVVSQFVDTITEFRAVTPGVETGVALAGRVVDVAGAGDKPGGRRIEVVATIAAGPSAARSAGHVTFDRPFQQRELERLQAIDPSIGHIGDAHLHPGSMDHCSEGDRRTDFANVKQSATGEMIFVIATVLAEHRTNRRDPQSIYEKGLKLDFFYMNSASSEYHKFKPQIVDGPGLFIPDGLRALMELEPLRTRLDLAAMRSLPGVTVRMSEMPIDGKTTPFIEATFVQGESVLIFVPRRPLPPCVYVTSNGQMHAFETPALAGEWTGQIWLTELVIQALERLTGHDAARRQRVLAASRSLSLPDQRESARDKGELATTGGTNGRNRH